MNIGKLRYYIKLDNFDFFSTLDEGITARKIETTFHST